MSMVTRRSFADERARFAREAVEKALSSVHLTHYSEAASAIPLVLHRHGLGQTLSYLQIRGGHRERSPYTLIYHQLAERLNAVFSLPDEDLLSSVTRLDSRQYLRLASEAHAYALALRRAAKEIIEERKRAIAEANRGDDENSMEESVQ